MNFTSSKYFIVIIIWSALALKVAQLRQTRRPGGTLTQTVKQLLLDWEQVEDDVKKHQ